MNAERFDAEARQKWAEKMIPNANATRGVGKNQALMGNTGLDSINARESMFLERTRKSRSPSRSRSPGRAHTMYPGQF
jgi:hypothetical protein